MSRPTIADLLRIVSGDQAPPPWLCYRLEHMAETIRMFVEGEESAPKRTEIRARLEAFRASVMQMQTDLADESFCAFLGRDCSELPADMHNVKDTLARLGDRAGVLSMQFSGRAGAGPAYPTEAEHTISARQLCAWTVMEAMRHCRGVTVVAADDRDAWAGCNCLFQIAGGQPMGKRATSTDDERDPSGWRRHITAIQHMEREQSDRSGELAFRRRTFDAIPPQMLGVAAI